MNEKKTILLISLLACFISVSSQSFNSDYRVISVHRKVSEISCGNPCESPLANYLARIRLWVDGKYDTIYSGMIDAVVKSYTMEPVSPKYAEQLLNSTIEEVIIYRDSVGYVTRKDPGLPGFPIGYSQIENGKWKGTGEDYYSGSDMMADVHQYIMGKATSGLLRLRRYNREVVVSADTSAFVKHLERHGHNPKDYLLNKLANHSLVIYGEFHRRKISWNFLKNVVRDPEFAKVCGTLFLELPSHTAPLFDEFLSLDTFNSKIIFDILGCEQIYGWQDKGEFEFIEEIWKLNKRLNNKITIVPVDFQASWKEIKTKQDWEDYERKRADRDSTMANLIEKTMKTKTDPRHCLFIVGLEHARKLSPAKPIKAGTLLSERLPENAVFSIIQHTLVGDNRSFFAPVRYGLYDYVFEQAGNFPVAFDLSGSPFGREPFDAIQELRFDPNGGNYEDFYDGYLFLGSLKEEEYDYTLFELFTDDFIEELKRRAAILGTPWGWYDIPVEELSKEKIINTIKGRQKCNNNKRFSEDIWEK